MSKHMTTMHTPEPSRLVLLGRGAGKTHADEIKSLGLKVGDTIRGKEGGAAPGRSWWHEVRLTVLWIGEKEVVYRKQWRANHRPDKWHDEGEAANFTLSCREYYLEENGNSGGVYRLMNDDGERWISKPDNGGDLVDMQDITAELNRLLDLLQRTHYRLIAKHGWGDSEAALIGDAMGWDSGSHNASLSHGDESASQPTR